VTATKYQIGYSVWNARLLGLLGLGPRHSSVIVADDEMTVTMGWGFAVSIPRESIASVEADDDRVWGWGVHGWRDRWLVNGTSRGLVRISIEPAVRARVCFIDLDLRVLRVSVDDRDALLAAMV
jgi:hypothetical protein